MSRSAGAAPSEQQATGDGEEAVVQQPAPDHNGYIFWLAEPKNLRTKSGWLRLAGWCLHVSGAPVTSLRARIGGRKFNIQLEISRPDVIDHFERSAEDEHCGFSIEVRTPCGRRLLTLEAQKIRSPWKVVLVATVQSPLLAWPGERRRRQDRDRDATVQSCCWWYDRPADWHASTRILYVSGRFIDTMGLSARAIRAEIGWQFFPANINLPRDDLSFPNLPLARRSGFALAIPLPRGTSKVTFQYQGEDRIWRDFDSHRVRRGDHRAESPAPNQLPFFKPAPVSNPRYYPRFSCWVHIPDNGEIRERRLRLAGWRFAEQRSAVEAVRARAGRRITVGEFGILRRGAGEFNFSCLINLGASRARRSIFLLLNNDVEIMNADCLSELVSQVVRPQIGVAGARLWYPNGTLQHGGVILMLRREVFEKLGGFDELRLPIAFNDVDFCLRARELGWRILYTPYAELIHHESSTRGIEDTFEKQRRFLRESEFLISRWGALIQNNPAYNPNLSLGEKRFELAFPPRVNPPWKKATVA